MIRIGDIENIRNILYIGNIRNYVIKIMPRSNMAKILGIIWLRSFGMAIDKIPGNNMAKIPWNKIAKITRNNMAKNPRNSMAKLCVAIT